MSQAELPLAFVAITVSPFVLTIAMGLILNPLADIAVTCNSFPYAIAMLDSIKPLAIVCVAVDPGVEALA